MENKIFPVSDKNYYNNDGVLILAKGMPITPNVKLRLSIMNIHLSDTVQQLLKNMDETNRHITRFASRMPQVDTILLNHVHKKLTDVLFSRNDRGHKLHLRALSNYVGWIYTHSINVAIISMMIGIKLGLGDEKVINLAIGGLLHDVGKMYLPRHIWEKTEKLDEYEWYMIKQHPTLGYEGVLEMPLSDDVKKIILQHHERVDGSGYPDGLANDEISQLSKIVMIADSFDAITSERSYRHSLAPIEALNTLKNDYDKYHLKYILTLEEIILDNH